MNKHDEKIYIVNLVCYGILTFILLILTFILIYDVVLCKKALNATSVKLLYKNVQGFVNNFLSGSSSAGQITTVPVKNAFSTAYFEFFAKGANAVVDRNTAAIYNNFNIRIDSIIVSFLLIHTLELIYSFFPLIFNIAKKQSFYGFLVTILFDLGVFFSIQAFSIWYVIILIVARIMLFVYNIIMHHKYEIINDKFNLEFMKSFK